MNFSLQKCARDAQMHRSWVNRAFAFIFNRGFEVQKTGKKAVLLTETGLFETGDSKFTIIVLTMPRCTTAFTGS
jgi:hypothetical protein